MNRRATRFALLHSFNPVKGCVEGDKSGQPQVSSYCRDRRQAQIPHARCSCASTLQNFASLGPIKFEEAPKQLSRSDFEEQIGTVMFLASMYCIGGVIRSLAPDSPRDTSLGSHYSGFLQSRWRHRRPEPRDLKFRFSQHRNGLSSLCESLKKPQVARNSSPPSICTLCEYFPHPSHRFFRRHCDL